MVDSLSTKVYPLFRRNGNTDIMTNCIFVHDMESTFCHYLMGLNISFSCDNGQKSVYNTIVIRNQVKFLFVEMNGFIVI